jgi:hypothetical protein
VNVDGGGISVETARVCERAALDVPSIIVSMGTRANGVGVERSIESEKITPRQQTEIKQIKMELINPVKQFFVSPEEFMFAEVPDEDDMEGVNAKPVPGAEMVGRIPRLPTLSVNPFPPIDEEIPDLLRLMRNPFPSGMMRRNRKGISYSFTPNSFWMICGASQAQRFRTATGIPTRMKIHSNVGLCMINFGSTMDAMIRLMGMIARIPRMILKVFISSYPVGSFRTVVERGQKNDPGRDDVANSIDGNKVL